MTLHGITHWRHLSSLAPSFFSPAVQLQINCFSTSFRVFFFLLGLISERLADAPSVHLRCLCASAPIFDDSQTWATGTDTIDVRGAISAVAFVLCSPELIATVFSSTSCAFVANDQVIPILSHDKTSQLADFADFAGHARPCRAARNPRGNP